MTETRMEGASPFMDARSFEIRIFNAATDEGFVQPRVSTTPRCAMIEDNLGEKLDDFLQIVDTAQPAEIVVRANANEHGQVEIAHKMVNIEIDPDLLSELKSSARDGFEQLVATQKAVTMALEGISPMARIISRQIFDRPEEFSECPVLVQFIATPVPPTFFSQAGVTGFSLDMRMDPSDALHMLAALDRLIEKVDRVLARNIVPILDFEGTIGTSLFRDQARTEFDAPVADAVTAAISELCTEAEQKLMARARRFDAVRQAWEQSGVSVPALNAGTAAYLASLAPAQAVPEVNESGCEGASKGAEPSAREAPVTLPGEGVRAPASTGPAASA